MAFVCEEVLGSWYFAKGVKENARLVKKSWLVTAKWSLGYIVSWKVSVEPWCSNTDPVHYVKQISDLFLVMFFRRLWSLFIYSRRIMLEVFEAVKFMHDNDIVHRDLKVCLLSISEWKVTCITQTLNCRKWTQNMPF